MPLDLEATKTQPEATATDQTPIVQQPEVKAHNTQSRARGKARTRVSLQRSKQPAPPHSPHLPQDLDTVAKKSQSNRKKRKPRGEHQSAKMTAKPAGAYVPPHLRKRAAAPAEPKTDVRLGDLGNLIAISSTPPASVKSQLEKPGQLQVSS